MGETLFPGRGTGQLLVLAAPLSLWGGVEPGTGVIVNARHPQRGLSLAGRVVAMRELIGSSSSASVMLELIHAGVAPAAVLLSRPDAILVVGCLAGRELGLTGPPVVRLADWPAFCGDNAATVEAAARDRPARILLG
jgi:predicted aconitase with swiveling domain